ncbi:hypothetical protein [Hyphomonas sp.]|uniref:hypothetical protein n=1 Tax=Hyphomonas sp. TaxID=87 RepID=UPI000C8C1F46|nr:hypothetical protein [Hyphomonas sp.]MAL45813.1 hypothetical protein [Hyphomonas sp.]
MGFLDNSGDIILDAVLTDAGRMRLAKGDGSFNITKFALADDEIDYGLYDKNHPSGSAYYDINILQTPVLESFTNNMSSMKSRLLSYSDNGLLYLPVILTNTNMQAFASGLNSYIVLADDKTVRHFTSDASAPVNTLADGILNGDRPNLGAHYVVADQGLDTVELSADQTLNEYDENLVENSYFVQLDNRLAGLFPLGAKGGSAVPISSIDDDQIATYIVSSNDDTNGTIVSDAVGESVIRGPLGTRVQFKIASSLNLKTSTFLFDQLGSSGTVAIQSGGTSLGAGAYKFIDSTVRISGVATGYTLDIPLRFVKKN